jgi:hypothetical protein
MWSAGLRPNALRLQKMEMSFVQATPPHNRLKTISLTLRVDRVTKSSGDAENLSQPWQGLMEQVRAQFVSVGGRRVPCVPPPRMTDRPRFALRFGAG